MTRLLSALALLVVIGGAAVFAPPEVLLIMAVAIASLAFIELARLGDALGARVPRAPGLLLTALVCVCVAWPTLSLVPAVVALLVGAGVVAVTGGTPDRAGVGGIALTVAGPLYIGLPLGALISIGWTHSREAAFLVVLTVVASDSRSTTPGACSGEPCWRRRSARRRRSRARSADTWAAHWPWRGWAACGCRRCHWGPGSCWRSSLVTLGIVGDLLESVLKRAAQVKDSSHVIPGHGGVLDRIDALLLVIPVYCVALRVASRGVL